MARPKKATKSSPAAASPAVSPLDGNANGQAFRALSALATSRAMTRVSPALQVLLFVWPHLDVKEYRPIKQAWVAKHLHGTQQHVSGILGSLVREGFLSAKKDGRLNVYRLNVDNKAVKEIYTDPLYLN